VKKIAQNLLDKNRYQIDTSSAVIPSFENPPEVPDTGLEEVLPFPGQVQAAQRFRKFFDLW
jgi:hypothetical protein